MVGPDAQLYVAVYVHNVSRHLAPVVKNAAQLLSTSVGRLMHPMNGISDAISHELAYSDVKIDYSSNLKHIRAVSGVSFVNPMQRL